VTRRQVEPGQRQPDGGGDRDLGNEEHDEAMQASADGVRRSLPRLPMNQLPVAHVDPARASGMRHHSDRWKGPSIVTWRMPSAGGNASLNEFANGTTQDASPSAMDVCRPSSSASV